MEFFDTIQLTYIFRLILATACGMTIGFERKNRAKEAGIRTHCVVACAAALMMIVSKYAFFDVIEKGMFGDIEVRLDPSRVASTIASGIGFLGAGMIFVHKNTISGLTTAAGIWATSGVGMAVGSGMYAIGIVATLIIIIVQVLFHLHLPRLRPTKLKKLIILNVTSEAYQHEVTEILKEKNIHIQDVYVSKDENSKKYTFIIELPQSTVEEDILAQIKYPCSLNANS